MSDIFYVLNEVLLSVYFQPEMFWDILFFKGMSLNEREGSSSFLVFLLNITTCACLVKSGLKFNFHWKTQLLITVRPLCKVAALDWVLLTTTKRDVSSAKYLEFEDTLFNKSLMYFKNNNSLKIEPWGSLH